MRANLYTKVVLTVIAIGLSVRVCNAQAPVRSSLDQEARKEAQKFFDKEFRRCGNSVFEYGNRILYSPDDPQRYLFSLSEFKGFTYQLKSEPLSEADRLNGLEWRGGWVTGSTSERIRDRKGGVWEKWEEWEPGTPLSKTPTPEPYLIRKKGQWVWLRSTTRPFGEGYGGYEEFDIGKMFTMPACDALTGATPSVP